MHKISGKYELADFVQAQKLHNQGNLFLQIVLFLSMAMMGVLALAGLYLAVIGRLDWGNALIPLGFFALVGVFRLIILPAQYRRIFNQHKELALPFECDLTQPALIFRNEKGSSTLPWLEVVQYREDQHTYLIYRTDTMFHMLPRRMFKDQTTANFLQDRLRTADIPPAKRAISPLQGLLLFVVVVGIIFIIWAILWPIFLM